RQMYDTLCEFTHPNWSGVMGDYSRIDKEKYILYLGKEHAHPPLAFGLGPLIGSLAIFQDHYNALADVLKQINERYEKKDVGLYPPREPDHPPAALAGTLLASLVGGRLRETFDVAMPRGTLSAVVQRVRERPTMPSAIAARRRNRRAVIIGGSMSGLFAAAFLRQPGWEPDVYAASSER